MTLLIRPFLSWRPGRYLHNAGQLLGWLLLRALAQAAIVVMLSRLLGATDYGRFVAIVAVASFLIPFAGLGLSGLLLRDGARNPTAIDPLLAQSLRVWLASVIACAIAALGLAWIMLPQDMPWRAASALIVMEVASASMTDLLARSEQARHRIYQYGAINAGLPLVRLLALVTYAGVMEPTLAGWLWVYACVGGAYAAAIYAHLRPKACAGASAPKLSIREGLPFVAAALSLRVQAEFNKPLLARAGFDQAAYMGIAQRATDLVSLPLMALQEALWPSLYADNEGHARLRKASLALVLVSILTGVALWFCAELVPLVLGKDFAAAIPAIHWIAWLPTLQLLRSFSNFQVVAAHRTNILGVSYVAGSLIAPSLMAVLIPPFALKGAIAAAYLGEVAIIATQQIMLLAGRWRSAERRL
jgi:O-antigen/teichoic acid export membrane protein